MRVGKWPMIWSVLCMLLVAAVVALGLALVANSHANHASFEEERVTACINHSLAVRQQYIEAQHEAEVAKVSGQVKGLLALKHGQKSGFEQFIHASEHYLTTIARIDKQQRSHPLGAC